MNLNWEDNALLRFDGVTGPGGTDSKKSARFSHPSSLLFISNLRIHPGQEYLQKRWRSRAAEYQASFQMPPAFWELNLSATSNQHAWCFCASPALRRSTTLTRDTVALTLHLSYTHIPSHRADYRRASKWSQSFAWNTQGCPRARIFGASAALRCKAALEMEKMKWHLHRARLSASPLHSRVGPALLQKISGCRLLGLLISRYSWLAA